MVTSLCDISINKATNNTIAIVTDHVQSVMENCTGAITMMRDDIRTHLKQEAAKAQKARVELIGSASAVSASIEKLTSAAALMTKAEKCLASSAAAVQGLVTGPNERKRVDVDVRFI